MECWDFPFFPAAHVELLWGSADPVRRLGEKTLGKECRMVHVSCHVNLTAVRMLGYHHVGLLAAFYFGPLANGPLVNALVLAHHLSRVNVHKVAGPGRYVVGDELLEAAVTRGSLLTHETDAHALFLQLEKKLGTGYPVPYFSQMQKPIK